MLYKDEGIIERGFIMINSKLEGKVHYKNEFFENKQMKVYSKERRIKHIFRIYVIKIA